MHILHTPKYSFASLFVLKQNAGIAIAELNNPLIKNALSKTMISEMRQTFTTIAASRDIHCLILKSTTPGIFCAGADLKERKGLSDYDTELLVQNLRDTFNMLYNLPQPTIALIDGFALGGGLELALACDMRVATSTSTLGLPETSLAIIPGAGGTQRTPRLIGLAKAKELIFTSKRLTAQQAYDYGLLNYVMENNDTALMKTEEIANQILLNGPIGVRAAKQAINRGSEVDIESGLRIEEMLYFQVCHSKDRQEGLKAFAEKRKPQYKGE